MSNTCVDNFIAAKGIFEAAIVANLHLNKFHPLTFDEWSHLDSNLLSAGLYCTFYDTISLARYKVHTNYSYSDDELSDVLYWLSKYSPDIQKDRKKFRPQYIYTIAWQSLYCVCLGDNQFSRAYKNNTSNITDDEIDLFSFVPDSRDFDCDIKDTLREKFWNTIDALGYDAVAVTNYLTIDYSKGESSDWSSFGAHRRWNTRVKRLKNHNDFSAVVNQLRNALASFSESLGGFTAMPRLHNIDQIIRIPYDDWPNRYKNPYEVLQKELGEVSPNESWYRIYLIEVNNMRYTNDITFSSPKLVYSDENADIALRAYMDDIDSNDYKATGKVIFLGYFKYTNSNYAEPTCRWTMSDFKRVSNTDYTKAREAIK